MLSASTRAIQLRKESSPPDPLTSTSSANCFLRKTMPDLESVKFAGHFVLELYDEKALSVTLAGLVNSRQDVI